MSSAQAAQTAFTVEMTRIELKTRDVALHGRVIATRGTKAKGAKNVGEIRAPRDGVTQLLISPRSQPSSHTQLPR